MCVQLTSCTYFVQRSYIGEHRAQAEARYACFRDDPEALTACVVSHAHLSCPCRICPPPPALPFCPPLAGVFQLGIAVGHLFYFLEFVYPEVAAIRGWKYKQVCGRARDCARRVVLRPCGVSVPK